MKLLKSLAVGLAAVFVILGILPLLMAPVWLHFLSRTNGDTYFVVWRLRSLPVGVAALVIFVVGFSRQFRRLSRTR